MSWSTLPEFRVALNAALSSYDWPEATRLCRGLIRQIEQEPAPCPAADAQAILASLRKKRRFELTAPVAEAFIVSGQSSPRVRRQYAQALIEQGLLVAAEYVSAGAVAGVVRGDGGGSGGARLLGRIYKQRYIAHSAKRQHLQAGRLRTGAC